MLFYRKGGNVSSRREARSARIGPAYAVLAGLVGRLQSPRGRIRGRLQSGCGQLNRHTAGLLRARASPLTQELRDAVDMIVVSAERKLHCVRLTVAEHFFRGFDRFRPSRANSTCAKSLRHLRAITAPRECTGTHQFRVRLSGSNASIACLGRRAASPILSLCRWSRALSARAAFMVDNFC
jgi:hypothetical protein